MGELGKRSEVRRRKSKDKTLKEKIPGSIGKNLLAFDFRFPTKIITWLKRIDTSVSNIITFRHTKQGLQKFIKTKVQASIVEPVIAVVILVITMAMAFTILTKTNITPIIQAKNKANELISTELFWTINETDFLDKEEQFGAFRLVKKVEQVQNNKTIKVSIQVFDLKQKEIMKKNVLIANPELLLNEK